MIQGSLLVHIAFHYNKRRIKYLKRVLSAISSYNFSNVDVVVDSNSLQSQVTCREIDRRVKCIVHEDLRHPHHLTWAHRGHMERQLDSYDYFMYVEDDILVPWRALEEWYNNHKLLIGTSFFSGFVRVEVMPIVKKHVTSDYARGDTYQFIDRRGKKFVNPNYPYCACWIYSRQQMEEFTKTDAWALDNVSGGYIREKAAVGMIHIDVPEGFKNRVLIPLNDKRKISNKAYVYHLPNNYAKNRMVQIILKKCLIYRKNLTPYGHLCPDNIVNCDSGKKIEIQLDD